MSVLGIDTSGPNTCIGLVTDSGAEIIELAEAGSRNHGEIIGPMLTALDLSEVSQIAVGVGPGAFTGLRVGIAVANAIGLALEVPVVGICSLDVLFAQSGLDAALCFQDARRGEIYWSVYSGGRRITDPMVAKAEDISAEFDDYARFTDVISGVKLAQLALRAPDLLLPVVPLYLRKPDAMSLVQRAVLASGVEIRPMLIDDLLGVMELETSLFGSTAWSISQFESELASPTRSYVSLVHENRVIGYGGVCVIDNIIDIQTIAIANEFQGIGLGQKLLLELERLGLLQGGDTIFLEVRIDNESAIKLYKRNGFERIDVRRNYYLVDGVGIDAISMRKKLSK